MSKITIVSRGDQALLIDISGCGTFKEAIELLSSAFLSANQFWQEQVVDLNLGSLFLNKAQVVQIIALANGIGAKLNQVFAGNLETIQALEDLHISVSEARPDAISSVSVIAKTTLTENISNSEKGKEFSEMAKVTSPEERTLDQSGTELKSDQTTVHNTALAQVIVFDGDAQESVPISGQEPPIETPYELSDSACATELETREDIVLAKSEDANKVGKPVALYIKQTLRAGQAVSHKGDLIIIGDVNAGAEVIAEGDITIWGSLRGIAHAGIAGNTKAEIRALRLQPIQIRIANYIARSPDGPNMASPGAQNHPYAAELAKLVNGKIRILRNTFEG